MVQVPTVVGSIQNGDLRGLVVTGERRNPALPDVPTMAEAGFKGAEATAWGGLLAPAGTPADIIKGLSAAASISLQKPDVKTRVANTGLEAVNSTPEAMATFMAEETRKWERVVREAHITAD
jgi:tripartite-type tricarboxylate transporter receptor subunit TctC